MVGCPVPILRQVMTTKDVADAMAYQRINPHTQERQDYRAGIISSTIANVNRGRGTKAYTPRDFMPDFQPKPKERPKELVQKIKEIFGDAKQS